MSWTGFRMAPRSEQCSICFEQMDRCAVADAQLIDTDCMHTFHRYCLARWLQRKRECPLCRAHVTVLPEVVQDNDNPDMAMQQMESHLQALLIDQLEVLILENRRNELVRIRVTIGSWIIAAVVVGIWLWNFVM